MKYKGKKDGTIKKKRYKKKKVNINKLEWLIKIIAIFALAMIVFWVKKYMQVQENKAKIKEESFFQYIEDRRIDYKADLTYSITGQIMEFKIKDLELGLDSTPIYYSEQEKIIFSQDMAIIFPNKNGQMRKIKKYTPITNEWYATYLNNYNSEGENDIDITEAFLYDASDVYVFPSEVTIIVKGESYALSPLSYAKVSYRDYIEFFNKDTQEYKYIELEDDDYVIAKNDYYEVDLSTDVLNIRGKEQLLLKNINYLDYIEK